MKRRLLRLGLFLTLGAIINVAVAWGLAVRPYPGPGRVWQYECGIIDVHNAAGELHVGQRNQNRSFVNGSLIEPAAFKALLPKSSHYQRHVAAYAQPSNIHIGESLSEHMFGWPSFSLCCERHYAHAPIHIDPAATMPLNASLKCAISLPIQSTTSNLRTHLPLSPLWPGFAINTLFYAVVVWLIFAAPFKFRRWRRVRRGLCVKCAYDLRGIDSDKCPECGWPRGRQPVVCELPHARVGCPRAQPSTGDPTCFVRCSA
jgi:hypothetical protein